MTTYLWNFGDGGTSTEQNPTYTYEVPGTYTVTLTVDGIERVQKVDFITVNEPPPSGFYSWVLDATVGASPVTTSLPETAGSTINTYTFTGSAFTAPTFSICQTDYLSDGFPFPNGYLEMRMTTQKTLTYLVPLLQIADDTAMSGYNFEVSDVSSSVYRLFLREVIGGSGNVVAISDNFTPGTSIVDLRFVDDGVTYTFTKDGVPIGTGPSVINPVIGTLGTCAVSSSNKETIYFAGVYGVPE